jgi:hypothetical protein
MRRLLQLSIFWPCLIFAPPCAETAPLAIAWQLDYAPDGMMLESRASAITEDGNLAVLAKLSPLGHRYDNNRGWIGLFSPSGTVKEQFAFVLQDGDTAVKYIDTFMPVGSGKFLVAGVAADGQARLVLLDHSGKNQLVRALGRKRLAFIRKLPSGDVVAGGYSERDLHALRMRANGSVLWDLSLDRGSDDTFIDAIQRGENIIALEHCGQREQFFMRDATMGLTVLGAGMDAIPRPSFAVTGRAGALVAANGGYAVLVDLGAGIKQRIRFTRLDAAFKMIGGTDLISLLFSLERARLARRKDGHYLVIAMDATRMVWLELDDSGTILGRLDNPVGHALFHPDIVVVNDIYSVLTELKELPNSVGVRRLLHIIKFSSQ